MEWVLGSLCLLFFFFFKQKTAYEMRISDWSSDVCSSDLLEGTTILLVIVPVLIPTAQALGIDMVHFGVVVIVNIMLGLVTPPYGLLLFIMTRIAAVPDRKSVV